MGATYFHESGPRFFEISRKTWVASGAICNSEIRNLGHDADMATWSGDMKAATAVLQVEKAYYDIQSLNKIHSKSG